MTITMEPIAVVGVSAIMPEAADAATFWNNIKSGRYSISASQPRTGLRPLRDPTWPDGDEGP